MAGIMDGGLIFVFEEVALQEMQFVTAESTILSPQWLLPCFQPVSLTPGVFWELSVGLSGFPITAELCRAALGSELGRC